MASTASPEPSRAPTEGKNAPGHAAACSTADSLPTPQPSTEIAAGKSPKLKGSFVLPPAAMGDLAAGTMQPAQTQAQSRKHSQQQSRARSKSDEAGNIESKYKNSDVKGKSKNKRPSSSGFTSTNNDPDYRPPKTRHTNTPSARRDSAVSSSTHMPGSGVQLPSPPTRARRIIQMKPPTSKPTAPAIAAADANSNADTMTSEVASTPGKRKSSGKGASNKKTARKTAHSLIERRRRSKMNEEFATLKGLVPACEGQEMHKLAILQASIDYVRYLQGCVDELQKGGNVKAFKARENTPRDLGGEMGVDGEDANEAEEEDNEMSEDLDEKEAPPSTSLSAVSPEVPVLNSGMASMHTSPNWTLPSPHTDAMPPSIHLPRPISRMELESRPESVNSGRDHAQRTAEALLMLTTDPRDWDGTRGMSVRDLLSNARE